MRNKARWLVTLVVIALVSSAMVSLSGPATATAPQAQGINGNTIKVGGMTDALQFTNVDDGFNARITRANKTKELGKYKIDFIGTTDVAQGQDKALSTTQNLIDREGVYAIAPVTSVGFQQPSGTYAASKKTPYFGGAFSPAWCGSNIYGFSPLGCAVGPQYSYTTVINSAAKALGKKPSQLRWAMVGRNEPSAQLVVNNFTQLAKAEGANVVYSKSVIPTGGGGDLQPFVSDIMASKPDIVWMLLGAEVLGLTSALKAAGYTGAMGNASFYSPGLFTKFPSLATTLEGALIQTSTPVLESGSPQVKQMLKDYKGIGKDVSDVTFGGEYGWMSADLMIAAMKKVAPNFDKLVPTISKGFTYTPQKDGTPFTWPAAYNSAGACTGIVKVVSAKYQNVVPTNCDGKRVKNAGN